MPGGHAARWSAPLVTMTASPHVHHHCGHSIYMKNGEVIASALPHPFNKEWSPPNRSRTDHERIGAPLLNSSLRGQPPKPVKERTEFELRARCFLSP